MSKVFKDPMDSVLIRLERDAKSIIKDWYHTLDQSQDQVLIKDLRKSREYDGNALRDLLRVLRNKVSFFHSYRYIFVEFFFFSLYINRETITKTSPTNSKSYWVPCQKASLNISRVGIQDCSFMCMKWLKRQVYIRNLCLKTISSCQKVKHGSSLFILFHSLLFYSFLFFLAVSQRCHSTWCLRMVHEPYLSSVRTWRNIIRFSLAV